MFQSLKKRLGFDTETPKATVCTSLACEELVREVEMRRNLHLPHSFYHKFPRFVINDNLDEQPQEEFVTEQIALQATKEASDITGVQLLCTRDNHVPPYYKVKGIIYNKEHPIIPQ